MRALSLFALSISLSACDTMPPPRADKTPHHAASTSASATAPNSQRLAGASTSFLDAARAYGATCKLESGYGQLASEDRCWRRGACPAAYRANFSEPCGHLPEQARQVVVLSKKLSELSTSSASIEARLFILLASQFGRFVRTSSVEVTCTGKPLCFVGTRGTLAAYQRMLISWNDWQPKDRRPVLPITHFIDSGQLRRYFPGFGSNPDPTAYSAEFQAVRRKFEGEGFDWDWCADGPCLDH